MPDARTQAALAHWAPRFVAQGVDYNDFIARPLVGDWMRERLSDG